jgi:beta-lactam-binding protein with PASTA domain
VGQAGKRVDGQAVTTLRHSMWRDIMLAVNERYQGDAFASVSERFTGNSARAVPDLTGADTLTAFTQLELAEFSMRIIQTPVSSTKPPGSVAYTVPAAGEVVPRGSLIEVYISGGGIVIMPEVRALTLSDATAVLASLGFTVSLPQPSQTRLYSRCDPLIANDLAYGTDPEAGALVQAGSAIVLIPNRCN